ncbi:MAG: hypothetical protein WEC54_01210, partial [Gemmatimonadales bacterium]
MHLEGEKRGLALFQVPARRAQILEVALELSPPPFLWLGESGTRAEQIATTSGSRQINQGGSATLGAG